MNTEAFGTIVSRFRKGKRVLTIEEWIMVVPNYTKYSSDFQEVVTNLVAAVVYQIKTGWIEQTIPKNNKLFVSRFWTNTTIMQKLLDDVLDPALLHCPITQTTATGVLPMTCVMHRLSKFEKVIENALNKDANVEALKSLCEHFVDKDYLNSALEHHYNQLCALLQGSISNGMYADSLTHSLTH